MRDKMNVRKLFRMTAFIRRRRSPSSHENRLWSGEKRFGRSQKWQDEFETHSYNVTAMEARSSTGLPTVKPEVLAAQHSALAAIGNAGILPDVSAEKLLTIAKIAYEEFDSDLRSALNRPLPQAKKALKRFPASAIRARKKYSCSFALARSWHSNRMACGSYVEWGLPKSRRIIQRHIV
jgi:hypothetical protein